MESLVRFSEINQTKTFEFHLTLSSKKISELVKRLDLLNIKKVSLRGKLSPLSLNEWRGKKNVEFIIDDISVNKNIKTKVPSSNG